MIRNHHVPAQVLVVVVAVSGLLVASRTPGGPDALAALVERAGVTEPATVDAAADVSADGPDQPGAGAAGTSRTPDAQDATDAPRDPAPDVPGLPVCTYDDLPTRFAELSDWPVTLLDTAFALSPTYRPDDLVPVGAAGVQGWGEIRAVVVDDLRAMDEASRAAGAGFAVRSAFRDHATQQDVFEKWVATIGEAQALADSARPGHSEHQLGTALDLRSADSPTAAWDYPDWGQTPTGTWLRENSWQYGFVLSYPVGQSAFTCYDEESWHFRYVGREMAEQIHTSGLTPREHLWRTSESQP